MCYGPSWVRQVSVTVAVLSAVLLSTSHLAAQVVLKAVGQAMERGKAQSLTFSPDGKKLLAGAQGEGLWLWDVETTTLIGQIEGLPSTRDFPKRHLNVAAAFTPDSKKLIAYSAYHIQSWDAAKAQPLAKLVLLVPNAAPQGQSFAGPLELGPDGKALLVHDGGKRTGTVNGKITTTRQPLVGLLLHTATGQRLGSPLLYEEKGKLDAKQELRVHACAFTSDGKEVVTFHKNGQVRFWDAATGKRKDMILQHPEKSARHLHVSPDGKTLAGVGANKVQLWDLTTGQALGPPLPSAPPALQPRWANPGALPLARLEHRGPGGGNPESPRDLAAEKNGPRTRF